MNEEPEVEKFALLMLGVIILIIMYAYFGNLLEARHVSITPYRSM